MSFDQQQQQQKIVYLIGIGPEKKVIAVIVTGEKNPHCESRIWTCN